MQASLLATAALTAEVGAQKQSLERTEQELGLAKRQLEEKEGKRYLIEKCLWEGAIAKNDRSILLIVGATTEVATLKQALSEAESGRNLRRRSARCDKSFRFSCKNMRV